MCSISARKNKKVSHHCFRMFWDICSQGWVYILSVRVFGAYGDSYWSRFHIICKLCDSDFSEASSIQQFGSLTGTWCHFVIYDSLLMPENLAKSIYTCCCCYICLIMMVSPPQFFGGIFRGENWESTFNLPLALSRVLFMAQLHLQIPIYRNLAI